MEQVLYPLHTVSDWAQAEKRLFAVIASPCSYFAEELNKK